MTQPRKDERGSLSAEDLDTARLLVQFKEGVPGAFDKLYERYLSRVYGYLRVALRDPHEAQDAAHEVFIKVLRALPAYEIGDVPFRVWLFRIVRNHTINHLKKHARVDVEDPAVLEERHEAEAVRLGPPAGSTSLTDENLLIELQRLPLAQRQALILRYVFGLRADEVAGVLDRTANAVSLLQRRGLTTLRGRLRPD